eukprot:4868382-Prymnesium_polylepis.1
MKNRGDLSFDGLRQNRRVISVRSLERQLAQVRRLGRDRRALGVRVRRAFGDGAAHELVQRRVGHASRLP